MHETSGWLESDDGIKLFLRRWMPAPSMAIQSAMRFGDETGAALHAPSMAIQSAMRFGDEMEAALHGGQAASMPRAVVHIVHGMAEHSLRYRRLAERLCGQGFAVWAADQRGHGRTADGTVNDPGRGGLPGHCADRDGFFRVVADIGVINAGIGRTHPGIPLFLLGHSWGSFISQAYIQREGSRLSGCILSGTRGPGGLEVSLGAPLLSLIAALKGSRRYSALAHVLADGAYNQPFKPGRTPFDWLSRDGAEVDAYIADPLCGRPSSVGFYRDMVRAFTKIHKPGAMKNIPRKLPVYVFSGSADPVGNMGQSPTDLVNAYRVLGMTELEFVLYPDARHETLNETNRDEVTINLISWLERRCPPAKTAE